MPQVPPNLIFVLILGGAIALGMTFLAVARPQRGAWIVAGMFFAASLGIQVDWLGRLVPTFWLRVQLWRSALYLGTGALLFVVTITMLSQRRLQRPSAPTVMLLVIATFAGLLRVVHGNPGDGLATLGLAVATIVPLGLFATSFAQEWNDWYSLMRVLMVANMVWVLGVFVQLVIKPSVLTVSQDARFLGLTGNPQHCAVYLSITGVVLLWLILHDPKRRHTWSWITLLGIDTVLLLWTGSRTGLLMLVVGSCMLLWRRLGRAMLILPVVAAIGIATVEMVPGIDITTASGRLTSTENTRVHAWGVLFAGGLENPVIGAGFDATREQDATENSYLLAWAAYGFGMVLIVFTLGILCLIQSISLLRARSRLGDEAPFVDLVVAYYPMFFLGALFEGYIMARVGVTLVFLVLLSSLGSLLLRTVSGQYSETDALDHAENLGEFESNGSVDLAI